MKAPAKKLKHLLNLASVPIEISPVFHGLNDYFGLFCSNRRLKVDEFDYDKKCSEIAQRIEGLSGREISKLGVAWQVSRL